MRLSTKKGTLVEGKKKPKKLTLLHFISMAHQYFNFILIYFLTILFILQFFINNDE